MIPENSLLESELIKSQKKYHHLFNQAPFSIVIFNRAGIILECNSATEKMFGYRKEGLIGKNYLELDITDSISMSLLRQRFNAISEGKIPQPIEVQIKKPDGKKIWIRSHLSQVNLNGEIIYQSIIEDITKAIENKKSLLETEKRYMALFEQSFYCIYLHDLSGQFIDANDAVLKMLGYTREEIPSINFTRLVYDDTEQRKALNLLKALQEKKLEMEPTVFKLKSKTGDIKWVKTQSTLLFRNGTPYAVQGIARDVTARIQAEQQLRESEARYRNIINNVKDALIIVGFDGLIKFISPQMKVLIGRNTLPEDIKSMAQLIHEDDAHDLIKQFEESGKARQNLFVDEIEFRMLHGDGHYIWLGASIREHYDQTDNITGLIAVLREITDRKLIEMELKQSEVKYRHLFEYSPSINLLLDGDGTIIDCNSALETSVGYKKEEIIGQNFMELNAIAPEYIRTITEYFQNIIKNDLTIPLELLVKKKDGSPAYIYAQGSLLKLGKEPLVQVIVQDITDRKEAELRLQENTEKYRILIELMNDGLAFQDENGIVTYVNQKLCDLLGYDASEMLGQHWSHLISSEGKYIIGNNLEKRKRGVSDAYEVALDTKNGESIYVILAGKPIFDHDGNYKGAIATVTNITPRVLAEQELKQSEEKYRLITENTNDLITVHDAKYHLKYFNTQTHTRILGYTKDELERLEMEQLFHTDDRPILIQIIKSAFETGEASGEFRFRKKDGTIIWVECFSKLYLDEKGQNNILSVARDITERKLAEYRMIQSKIITDNLHEGLVLFDPEGKVSFVNPAFENLMGFTNAELIGLKGVDLTHKIVVSEEVEPVLKAFRLSLNKGKTIPIKTQLKHKNGRIVPIEFTASYVRDEMGNIMNIVTVITDLSERIAAEKAIYESEEKYRELVENINEVIYTIDLDGTLIYLSPAIELLLGYKPSELIGKKIFSYFYSEDVSRAQKSFQSILSGHSSSTEYRLTTKSGDLRWIRTSSKPIFKDEVIIGIQGLFIDITEKKLLEQRRRDYMQILEQEVKAKTIELHNEKEELQKALDSLKNTQEQLIQSEKLASLGLLAAGVAHEINNPLMGIINYAQIIFNELRAKNLVDTAKKPYSFLNGIIKEGQRISSIVDDLLTFAREDTGQFTDCSIDEVITSTLVLIKPKLNNSLIDLKLDFDGNLPLISINKQKIQQVLLNILQNSIAALNEKFSLPPKIGKKVISISVTRKAINAQTYVQIKIKDNGQGIRPEHLPRIFDPFFTTKSFRKEQNIGLGLSISYGIIKDHGGDIKIESIWKKETTVNIYLPI
ncbi:MAG: PAS domain S-box protein [Candidatus Helarchaeota archaeon]